MAPGVKKLRRLQMGKESTGGTAVAATARWRGGGTLKDALEVLEVDEDLGILGGVDRTVITKLLAGLDLAPVVATFQQVQYLPVLAYAGPVTGAADGPGTDKIYTTNIPTTALPTLTPYTFEGGDSFEVERMEYAVATKMNFKGEVGGALMMSGSLLGRQIQRLVSGFTGALTIPTVEDIVVNKGKLYLDAIGGSYGTTQIAQQIIGIDITHDITIIPQFTMDGQLYYSFPQYVDHKVTGKITFLHDAAASGNAGAKADWRAQTPKKLRVDFIGSNVATPGTTYSQQHFIMDLPVKWKVISPLDDKNGVDIVTAEFRSRYDQTAGDAGKFIAVFEAAALP